ncbi:MAG: M48 family metallopeptidase [Bacteroidales bacterium]|nr:M48 family metallopeptidase [Bacteroidales bacterium]
MKEKFFPGIGVVHFQKRKGSRRIGVKVKNGEVYVTVPYLVALSQAEMYVLQLTDKIVEAQKKQLARKVSERKIVESQAKITHFRDLKLVRGDGTNMRGSITRDTINIIVPQSVAVENEQVQSFIKKAIQKALRKEAQDYLPKRTESLANQFGFGFSGVTISSAKGRWGSCNSKKHIVFSLFLMTMPFHLIDYVILHELCHTVYMNHSNDFYALLDKCVGGKHAQYRKEMKQCAINVFPKFAKDSE